MITIYTDGSCIHSANTDGNAIGPGGYAAILYYLDSEQPFHIISGGSAQTTNNRMEIAAVLEALKYLAHNNYSEKNITIYSDSQYVINSLNTWLKGWVAKNFNKVKNDDLWRQIHPLTEHFIITGVWVRGHAGNYKNELANTRAQQEAYKLKG